MSKGYYPRQRCYRLSSLENRHLVFAIATTLTVIYKITRNPFNTTFPHVERCGNISFLRVAH